MWGHGRAGDPLEQWHDWRDRARHDHQWWAIRRCRGRGAWAEQCARARSSAGDAEGCPAVRPLGPAPQPVPVVVRRRAQLQVTAEVSSAVSRINDCKGSPCGSLLVGGRYGTWQLMGLSLTDGHAFEVLQPEGEPRLKLSTALTGFAVEPWSGSSPCMAPAAMPGFTAARAGKRRAASSACCRPNVRYRLFDLDARFRSIANAAWQHASAGVALHYCVDG